jgi:hypothetical protein
MGYIHDTAMSQFIPPEMIGKSATAAMTLAAATNVWSDNRTANDSSFTLYIPVLIPSCSVPLKGAYLKSIELMYSIGTADADDVATVKLYKDTLKAVAASGSGTLNTAAEITAVTIDVGHDTDAERYAQDEHRMVVTLDTPEWIDNDATFHLEVVVNAAATTVVKIFGAIINYTFRL